MLAALMLLALLFVPDDAGDAWVRQRVDIPAASGQEIGVHVAAPRFTVVEVFANGNSVGHIGSLPPDPKYPGPNRRVFRIPANAELSIHVWKPPGTRGTQYDDAHQLDVRIGDLAALQATVSAAWYADLLSTTPELILVFLFVSVGLYHIQLYRRRRASQEYFWFGLLAIAFAFNTLSIIPWSFAAVDDRLLALKLTNVSAQLVAVCGIQFLFQFLKRPINRWWRAYQFIQIALAVLVIVWPDPALVWRYDAWLFFSTLPAIAAAGWLVAIESWRGSPDARTIAVGCGLFVVIEVFEVLRVSHVLDIRSPAPYSFLFIAVFMAMALSNRFSRVFADLDALNRDLERKVDERTEDLTRANIQLGDSERRAREANRAKSVFLSNMSHELRTPLNAILGFAQILDRDRGLSAPNRSSVQTIARSGEHLLSLINDVLSLSKIEAGKLQLDARPFDPDAMLRVVEEIVAVRVKGKPVELAVVRDTGLPHAVTGDEGKLRQILINLLGNAVKFTDKGSITLRARWEGDVATFSVTDTGSGIPADKLDHIFEAFAQAEQPSSVIEGTGLGLAISRDLARLMGGDLAATSEVGVGSVFTVTATLPVAEVAVEEEERRVVRGLRDSGELPRILIVDDTVENRSVLAALLEPVGFAVRQAANGSEAVEVWREWQPSAIFMDMRMPVMDGYAATAEIRRLEAAAGTGSRKCAIIALTASAFEHDRGRILDSGCDDVVAKPYRADRVFEKLTEFLEVEYVYDGDLDESGPEAAVGPTQVASETVALLTEAVTAGDLAQIGVVIDRIAASDDALAGRLREMLKAYQFDEMLDAVAQP